VLSIKKRYFIISDLINFQIKIIPEKSRIDFEALENTLKAPKIQGKKSY